MLAAIEGRTDVVEELIRWRADVNARDKVRCLSGFFRQWCRREGSVMKVGMCCSVVEKER